MGFFNRKKDDAILDDIWTLGGEPASGIDYDRVMNWLVGLSKEDYSKVIKVADVYRQAEMDANDAMGVETKPYTYVTPPHIVVDPEVAESSFLDDDIPFIAEPTKKSTKKISVDDGGKDA